jgi:RND family efflux transporter MFP subunit
MNESGFPHKGTIDYIAPNLDASTGTLEVRGIFENANRALLPGMFAQIRVPLAVSETEALLVPDMAIGADQAGNYLLLVDKDNVVQQRTVVTGQLVGPLRVITSGLTADDVVVVSGNQRAIPGQKINPQATTLTPPPAATPPPKASPAAPAAATTPASKP